MNKIGPDFVFMNYAYQYGGLKAVFHGSVQAVSGWCCLSIWMLFIGCGVD